MNERYSQITLQVLLVILFLVFVRSLSSLDFPCRSCFRECGFMCWSLRVSDCELEAHIIFLFFVVAVVSVFFFCLQLQLLLWSNVKWLCSTQIFKKMSEEKTDDKKPTTKRKLERKETAKVGLLFTWLFILVFTYRFALRRTTHLTTMAAMKKRNGSFLCTPFEIIYLLNHSR